MKGGSFHAKYCCTVVIHWDMCIFMHAIDCIDSRSPLTVFVWCSIPAEGPQAWQYCDAARYHLHQNIIDSGLRVPCLYSLSEEIVRIHMFICDATWRAWLSFFCLCRNRLEKLCTHILLILLIAWIPIIHMQNITYNHHPTTPLWLYSFTCIECAHTIHSTHPPTCNY